MIDSDPSPNSTPKGIGRSGSRPAFLLSHPTCMAGSTLGRLQLMSVNTKIYLPANVRVSDVATVMSALSGGRINLVTHRRTYGETDWQSVKAPDVMVHPTSQPEMAQIVLNAPTEDGKVLSKLVDGQERHHCFYHFEGGNGGCRLLNPPCSAFWICVGRGLVDFFGGYVDYSDSDATDVNYGPAAKSDSLNCPEDGEEWDNLQLRMSQVKPITKAQLKEFKQYD